MNPESPIASAFRAASHYGHETRASVDLFCLHTAECRQGPNSAEAVAGYFSMQSVGVSAHYTCDSDSVVQCVPEAARAWAAGHQGNERGIHLELAGYARETAADWGSAPNQAMLALASRLAADVCARWDIPLAFVDAAGLLRGERGITTHAEVSKAWHETTHTDPGSGFDVNAFIGLCVLARSDAPPNTQRAT